MIKLRILRCVNYLGLSEWAQSNSKGPYKRDREGEYQNYNGKGGWSDTGP